jgi:hypothetical protein
VGDDRRTGRVILTKFATQSPAVMVLLLAVFFVKKDDVVKK